MLSTAASLGEAATSKHGAARGAQQAFLIPGSRPYCRGDMPDRIAPL